ncbi:MAG: hypothetical protein J5565_06870 [Muribaculaceae bacterium]|nr:hypothetical protein [Muribaculaceae bacterium]
MENKRINVVWCDDAIDRLYDEDIEELFLTHNCILFRKARTSEELKIILKDYRNQIDAVIVDLNMGRTELTPSEEEATGFSWVHEHFKEYDPIPFYLYTGRNQEFIEKIYKDFQYDPDGDYFFSNRIFLGDVKGLLEMIKNEVAAIGTPTYRIRQEYHEAFAALNNFGLDGNEFISILLLDEKIDRFELTKKPNSMRKIIEEIFTILVKAYMIPIDKTGQLNELPNVLSEEYQMPEALRSAFKFFLQYIQDGSHRRDNLKIEFDNYLYNDKDIYLLKSLAIIGLDLIKWVWKKYDEYKLKPRFKFEPFEGEVYDLQTDNKRKEHALVKDSEGSIYAINLTRLTPQERNQFKIGTKVKIEEITPFNGPLKSNFYVKKHSLI